MKCTDCGDDMITGDLGMFKGIILSICPKCYDEELEVSVGKTFLPRSIRNDS